MERVDCVVIGAGVVGLAVARELARAGRDVLIVEAAGGIGSGVSSRSSEVIHAGIYYPPGSAKARLCLRGRELLLHYCIERRVDHKLCGKLIVATEPNQLARLHALAHNAAACGAPQLQWLDAAHLRGVQPQLRAHAALWSASTGIVDSHALMFCLLADAEAAGAVLVANARVVGGRARAEGIELQVASGTSSSRLLARSVVNSAGLDAVTVASSIEGIDRRSLPRAYRAKGHYFRLAGHSAGAPFEHLVYPLPEPGGLGIHLTLDLAGQLRFGPDVQWVEDLDYAVAPERARDFAEAIRTYWPELPAERLEPAYAGIRPKISGPGEAAVDFRIDGEDRHGVAGLVNLLGIESPGLTAALAIGEQVAGALGAGRPAAAVFA